MVALLKACSSYEVISSTAQNAAKCVLGRQPSPNRFFGGFGDVP